MPAKAYSATAAAGGKLHFHQLCAECQSRIRHVKMCPVHGERTKDEIVTGYEYSKGQYVLIEPEELEKALADDEKSISIEAFTEPEKIDPLYFSGRTYYLAPDGPAGAKSYAVLQRVLSEKGRWALAQMVLSAKGQLCLLRPLGKLLALNVLSYASQVKRPESFEGEVPEAKISAEELRLADTLVDASTVDEVDLSKYRDDFTEKMLKLIEAKAKGQPIRAAQRREEPAVINLMDALRKSVAKTMKDHLGKTGKTRGKAKTEHTPARRRSA